MSSPTYAAAFADWRDDVVEHVRDLQRANVARNGCCGCIWTVEEKKSMFLFAIYENLDRKRKHTFYFCQGLFRVFKGSSDVTGTKEKEKVLKK